MQTSSIKGLLDSSLGSGEFNKKIANELDEFKKSRELSSSTPMHVTVDTDVFVDEAALCRLCSLYIADDQRTTS